MSYTALYRKFRPERFEDVKGQDHIVTTLRNQIEADRIGHAYLFCGTRGTGKTTIAKIFAKAVNCEHPVDGSPCGECRSCRAKVYIIDEVHMLSIGAFNALLKTLEEPPSYVIFILATTEVHKIPVTILSRCQRYDFKRITIDTITGRLRELMVQEQQQVEEKALRYVAKAADGSMRDALSLLDQCIAFHYGKELTYDMVLDVLGAVDTEVFSRLLRAVLDRSVTDCIGILEEIVMQGRELTQFVSDFAWYLRNLLLIKTSDEGAIEDVIDVSSDNLVRLKEEAEMAQPDAIMRYIRELSELSGRIRYAGQKRILIEMALIKLCRPQMEVSQDSLLDRLRAVEQQLEKGIVMQAPAGTQAAGGTAANAPSGAAQTSLTRAELPKAIPEDVSKIVANWPTLVGQTAMPMKLYLKKAKLSLGGDNRLMLVVEDGLASDYFLKQEGNKQELEKLLSEFSQKQIEVNITASRSDRDFEDSYVDLTQIIHMEIEEE